MRRSESNCEKSNLSLELVLVFMLSRRASLANPESDSVDEVESVNERSRIGRLCDFSTDFGFVWQSAECLISEWSTYLEQYAVFEQIRTGQSCHSIKWLGHKLRSKLLFHNRSKHLLLFQRAMRFGRDDHGVRGSDESVFVDRLADIPHGNS